MERAEAERDYLEHAAEELRALNPVDGEEAKLAEARQMMMSAEQYADALADAEEALAGDGTSVARLNAALRKLERRRETAGGGWTMSARRSTACWPRSARPNAPLPRRGAPSSSIRRSWRNRRSGSSRCAPPRGSSSARSIRWPRCASASRRSLQALSDGGGRLRELETGLRRAAREAYDAAAEKLSDKRREDGEGARQGGDGRIAAAQARAGALRNARSRPMPESPGRQGIDRIEFMVAANPGTPLAPLMKVASGGELARFMLALKVILAAKGSAPTLIFDEIDTGVGGAVADAIGARLARLAEKLAGAGGHPQPAGGGARRASTC